MILYNVISKVISTCWREVVNKKIVFFDVEKELMKKMKLSLF